MYLNQHPFLLNSAKTVPALLSLFQLYQEQVNSVQCQAMVPSMEWVLGKIFPPPLKQKLKIEMCKGLRCKFKLHTANIKLQCVFHHQDP
mmetsp:Transcript_19069/g.34648  ORF Transcript_19069/g.34648 Transcript_19069/m.34648 type:complete len:89 (+) Transcript_19069:511-777(+)